MGGSVPDRRGWAWAGLGVVLLGLAGCAPGQPTGAAVAEDRMVMPPSLPGRSLGMVQSAVAEALAALPRTAVAAGAVEAAAGPLWVPPPGLMVRPEEAAQPLPARPPVAEEPRPAVPPSTGTETPGVVARTRILAEAPRPAVPPAAPAPAVPGMVELTRIAAVRPGGREPVLVQLVAAGSEAEAMQHWARFAAREPELAAGRTPVVLRVERDAQPTVWRLRVGGFGSAEEASRWCAGLREKRLACWVAG